MLRKMLAAKERELADLTATNDTTATRKATDMEVGSEGFYEGVNGDGVGYEDGDGIEGRKGQNGIHPHHHRRRRSLLQDQGTEQGQGQDQRQDQRQEEDY